MKELKMNHEDDKDDEMFDLIQDYDENINLKKMINYELQ